MPVGGSFEHKNKDLLDSLADAMSILSGIIRKSLGTFQRISISVN
jgi:hypothetical protein